MTAADARGLMFTVAGDLVGFLGWVAVILLGLSLIGLAGRW